jgi:hypothetical protein
MANYITAPFFAAIGVAEGVITKTNALIGTVRGRGHINDKGQEQHESADVESDANQQEEG